MESIRRIHGYHYCTPSLSTQYDAERFWPAVETPAQDITITCGSYFLPFFFLPGVVTGVLESTSTASSSLPTLALPFAGSSPNSFMKSLWIISRLFSHHSFSATALF